jgi:hypothetical protein
MIDTTATTASEAATKVVIKHHVLGHTRKWVHVFFGAWEAGHKWRRSSGHIAVLVVIIIIIVVVVVVHPIHVCSSHHGSGIEVTWKSICHEGRTHHPAHVGGSHAIIHVGTIV